MEKEKNEFLEIARSPKKDKENTVLSKLHVVSLSFGFFAVVVFVL